MEKLNIDKVKSDPIGEQSKKQFTELLEQYFDPKTQRYTVVLEDGSVQFSTKKVNRWFRWFNRNNKITIIPFTRIALPLALTISKNGSPRTAREFMPDVMRKIHKEHIQPSDDRSTERVIALLYTLHINLQYKLGSTESEEEIEVEFNTDGVSQIVEITDAIVKLYYEYPNGLPDKVVANMIDLIFSKDNNTSEDKYDSR